MKLYFVSGINDGTGDDMSMFVVAENPQRAEDLWGDAWENDFDADRVFEVPAAVEHTVARVLEWHGDVKQVGGAKKR